MMLNLPKVEDRRVKIPNKWLIEFVLFDEAAFNLQICEKHQELWLYNMGIKTTSILYLWYKQVTKQTFMTWHNIFIKLRLRAMTN